MVEARLRTAYIRQQSYSPRPYERKHPLPCLTDVFSEVLILLLQPNQGCSRLESLYYISNTIPHIVGRLYEFIDTASYWLAKHKKAYPNPSCSKYSGSRPRKPLRENGWDGYAITAYLTPKVSLSFVGRQFEYLNLSHKICILLSAKYAPPRLGLSSLRLPCAA